MTIQTTLADRITDDMIAKTISTVSAVTFTTLDFCEEFKRLYPAEWEMLVRRYGLYGQGRQYTVNCYLAQRIQRFSWKTQHLLHPHTPWSVDKDKDFRAPTEREQGLTGGVVIAVFRKRH